MLFIKHDWKMQIFFSLHVLNMKIDEFWDAYPEYISWCMEAYNKFNSPNR